MEEDIKFSSLNELYSRLMPALKTKARELRAGGYSYIVEEDIWNYLKENVWNKASNLSLHDMVTTVLNVDVYALDAYIKEHIGKVKRTIEPDETIL